MISATNAERALGLAREALQGAKFLRDAGEFDTVAAGMALLLLKNSVFILDLFLTQSPMPDSPQVQREIIEGSHSKQLLAFLAGGPSAVCLLSNQRAQLVFQWPTSEDPREIYPVFLSEDEKGIALRRRWARVDNVNSKATDFNHEVFDDRA